MFHNFDNQKCSFKRSKIAFVVLLIKLKLFWKCVKNAFWTVLMIIFDFQNNGTTKVFDCASFATNFDSIEFRWKKVFLIFLPDRTFFPRKIAIGFSLFSSNYVTDVGLARTWKRHLLYERQTHSLTTSGRYLTERALTSLIFIVAACADFGVFLQRSNQAFSGVKGSAKCPFNFCIFQVFKKLIESIKKNVFEN